jgi:UDP-N-acetylmuramoyl-tripeptide--D-alanyl-D-alanine ligase
MIQTYLQHYEGIELVSGNWDAVDYRKLSIDSRTIRPGELFLALRGENHDGHAFVAGALEKKAAATVVEKNWFNSNKALFKKFDQAVAVVENTLDFLQRLGAWHRRQFPIPVIGLTGSNGKTTTREMISAVLSARFKIFRSRGNKNNHIGLPLMLLQITPETEIAVIEMGTNHPGEIALLTELTGPNAGLITNVGKGHIGFFGSLEEVYREKTALFDGTDKAAPIFINMEDRFLRNYPRDNRIAITVGYSKKYHTRGRIEFIDRFGRVKFRLNEEVPVHLRLPGTHQVPNALLAAAVGLLLGVEIGDVQLALENFSPPEKRMEIFEKNDIIFINDAYNANPDSMRAAVNYLMTIKNGIGKRILVLGDMLELGEFSGIEHYQLGEYIAEKPVNFVFLYGPESRYMQEAIDKAGQKKQQVFWYQTHPEISEHLNQILTPRDVVLVKGSRGMVMEKVFDNLWN